MNVGIFANMAKPAAASTLADLAAAARELKLRLVACDRATLRHLPGARYVPPARFGRSIDLLLSLGGDGTVLQAVRALDGGAAPILGINLGNLGFLTSVPDVRAVEALRALASGRYEVAAYPLLDARLVRGARRRQVVRARALNDVVMGWGTSPRATMIEVEVDRQPVALSAGGPILHRETPALVLEPICPHTLSNRPVVLPNDRVVTLRVGDKRKKLLLAVDGQPLGWLEYGDRLEVRKAPGGVRFVHLPGYSWFKLLSQKLHWRGSSADPK